ncbi:type II secretion system protein [sulfur-oxidizing endosymbiont of Gigantopelta aegis]|uniref:type II secretion system protein n=1 Tax=sulfur-oxidizing endosymbiont of Gigantopelta aegis TaxID=2794934 RepID=UPI0018DCF946|nr:type II secretion system protein [sulfur-oxidizing endosymbiont of Gigantopelta aegis]
MYSKQSNSGFTLIELITVILILGILAATALPKFMDVTDQAHEAAVAGVGGGLGSGIALAHAQWIANGDTSATTVPGFGDGIVPVVSASGWPTATTDATCISNVWQAVMQNPPTISAGTSTTDTTNDYTATFASSLCTYNYRANKTGTAASTMSITYNPANGAVVVDAIN